MSLEEATDCPTGWTRVAMGEIVSDMQTGFACGVHNRRGSGIAHLRPMNVNLDGHIDLEELKFVTEDEVSRDERWVRKGDVIFNNTNSPELVGKTAFYDLEEPRAFSNHMTRIRFREGVSPQFCAMFLHQRWRQRYFEGTCNNHVSQASVSRKSLSELAIWLPPTQEQLRIVTAVERILRRVAEARERLERVPLTLKRFRQSVLRAACSGRLTANWRTSTNSGDTGEQLLIRLRRERQVMWLEKNPRKAYSEPEAANKEESNLPENWTQCRAEEICHFITKGTTPQSTAMASTGDIPFIKVYNLGFDGPLHFEVNPTFIPLETQRSGPFVRSTIRPDDVLMNLVGPPLGKVAVVPHDHAEWNCNQAIVIYRTLKGVSPWFVAYVLLMGKTLEDVIMSAKTTTGHHNLTLEMARDVRLPLPPESEQVEIVRQVDALMRYAAAVEQRAKVALQRIENIPQAVLAKAFRGELVPTEAELARRECRSYEPASELLSRPKNSVNGKVNRTRAKPTSKKLTDASEGFFESTEG